MKYDSKMTAFDDDIIRTIKSVIGRSEIDVIKTLAVDGDASLLREWLKDNHGRGYRGGTIVDSQYSDMGASFYGCSSKGLVIEFDSPLNECCEKELMLSWSQVNVFIRNHLNEIFPTERNDEMIVPSKRIPPADAEKAVSERYIEALNLNNKIIVSAQLAQQNLYDMCMGFKKMRDNKLYKELGYSDFGEYCENETGFKRRQVYSYISIAEKFSTEFVRSSAQIGVKKLELLTRLSDEDRTEITASTDLENTTVKELERQIKELKAQKEKSIESFNRVADQSKANFQKYLEEKHKRENLAVRCKELENRPVEVATQIVEKIPDNYITPEAYEKMVTTYTEQLEKADEEFIAEKRRAFAEKEELERKIAELENAPHESDSKEMFAMLCQMCRHPLNKLALFICDHPEYKGKFKSFVTETTEIIDKEN